MLGNQDAAWAQSLQCGCRSCTAGRSTSIMAGERTHRVSLVGSHAHRDSWMQPTASRRLSFVVGRENVPWQVKQDRLRAELSLLVEDLGGEVMVDRFAGSTCVMPSFVVTSDPNLAGQVA